MKITVSLFFFTLNLASKADHLRLFHLLNWDPCTIWQLKLFWGFRAWLCQYKTGRNAAWQAKFKMKKGTLCMRRSWTDMQSGPN